MCYYLVLYWDEPKQVWEENFHLMAMNELVSDMFLFEKASQIVILKDNSPGIFHLSINFFLSQGRFNVCVYLEDLFVSKPKLFSLLWSVKTT